jgi:hypothetical protein
MLSYFEQAYRSNETGTNRMFCFKSVHKKLDEEEWRSSEMQVGNVHVHSFSDEEKKVKIGIADMCNLLDGACWEVDFGNSNPGGGVLGVGALQEEIRFLECPELIVSRFFIRRIHVDQAVHATGFRQFNDTKGYSSNHPPKFEFDKKHEQRAEPTNKRKMIMMDAKRYSKTQSDEQFTMVNINRDLQKAYIGFSTGTDPDPIATGHWGAGDFQGDKQLKALIHNGRGAVFGSGEKPH